MAYNTIRIQARISNIQREREAASAITPGELLEVTSAGKYQAHSTADGPAMPIFALENELNGDDIDTDYASGTRVQGWYPARGDEVYAILADGQNVSIGDYLVSNGDGTLKKWVGGSAGEVEYPGQIIGQAEEALDLSGSSGEESSGPLGYNKRIHITVM